MPFQRSMEDCAFGLVTLPLENRLLFPYIRIASGKGRQASLLRADALIARSHFLGDYRNRLFFWDGVSTHCIFATLMSLAPPIFQGTPLISS